MRRGLPLFLGVVVCLAFWQVRLAWQLREQDRVLGAQRARESLEQTADLALAQLITMLDDWAIRVRILDKVPPPAPLQTKLPERGTFILLDPGGVATYPAKPLLFVPAALSVAAPRLQFSTTWSNSNFTTEDMIVR